MAETKVPRGDSLRRTPEQIAALANLSPADVEKNRQWWAQRLKATAGKGKPKVRRFEKLLDALPERK